MLGFLSKGSKLPEVVLQQRQLRCRLEEKRECTCTQWFAWGRIAASEHLLVLPLAAVCLEAASVNLSHCGAKMSGRVSRANDDESFPKGLQTHIEDEEG